jgi:hypothetical protein
MKLIVHDQIDPGALLKIEPEEVNSGSTPFLWVRVIHAVPAEEGVIVLGCVFPHELDDEELKHWGGRRLQPRQEDYRAWVRFPCDAQANFRPAPSSDPGEWQAQVVDVSPSGIGLIVSRNFQPGTMLNVALPAPSNQLFRSILACVVRVTPQEIGQWELGCTFATELNDEDLEAFGVARVKSLEADCRTWVRCPCGMELSYRAMKNREENPWSAKVLNLSANGIGLLVSRPVEPGVLLSVELHRNENSNHQRFLVCVVYVRELENGKWILGCTFASDLSVLN